MLKRTTQPKTISFTPEGFAKLKKQYQDLLNKRPQAVLNLKTAREMGDLSENAAYKAAKFELNDIDRRIRKLVFLMRFAKVREKGDISAAGFGSVVTVRSVSGNLTFTLVGGFESNPEENKLSVESPMGRGVYGKKTGDRFTIVTPSGSKDFTIVKIE